MGGGPRAGPLEAFRSRLLRQQSLVNQPVADTIERRGVGRGLRQLSFLDEDFEAVFAHNVTFGDRHIPYRGDHAVEGLSPGAPMSGRLGGENHESRDQADQKLCPTLKKN